jgi:hypothetical protein
MKKPVLDISSTSRLGIVEGVYGARRNGDPGSSSGSGSAASPPVRCKGKEGAVMLLLFGLMQERH